MLWVVIIVPLPQDVAPNTSEAPASFSRALPSQPGSAPAPRAGSSRFLPPGLLQAPVTNPNQGIQNTLAAGGLGAVGAVAAGGAVHYEMFEEASNDGSEPEVWNAWQVGHHRHVEVLGEVGLVVELTADV